MPTPRIPVTASTRTPPPRSRPSSAASRSGRGTKPGGSRGISPATTGPTSGATDAATASLAEDDAGYGDPADRDRRSATPASVTAGTNTAATVAQTTARWSASPGSAASEAQTPNATAPAASNTPHTSHHAVPQTSGHPSPSPSHLPPRPRARPSRRAIHLTPRTSAIIHMTTTTVPTGQSSTLPDDQASSPPRPTLAAADADLPDKGLLCRSSLRRTAGLTPRHYRVGSSSHLWSSSRDTDHLKLHCDLEHGSERCEHRRRRRDGHSRSSASNFLSVCSIRSTRSARSDRLGGRYIPVGSPRNRPSISEANCPSSAISQAA